tara:strand:+ start:451 stop:642 length:192 start_codon:yes stop_codon:yes gene_type:complete
VQRNTRTAASSQRLRHVLGVSNHIHDGNLRRMELQVIDFKGARRSESGVLCCGDDDVSASLGK